MQPQSKGHAISFILSWLFSNNPKKAESRSYQLCGNVASICGQKLLPLNFIIQATKEKAHKVLLKLQNSCLVLWQPVPNK